MGYETWKSRSDSGPALRMLVGALAPSIALRLGCVPRGISLGNVSGELSSSLGKLTGLEWKRTGQDHPGYKHRRGLRKCRARSLELLCLLW